MTSLDDPAPPIIPLLDDADDDVRMLLHARRGRHPGAA